ncbi:toxin VasX [Pseudomonas sp. GM80]|uniref:toxin VasX n=1 Tax=Pseudomonas sp. GM80 TaxID=1144339 RepID=UPI00026F950D|nr:toxin VasX [Pseudomonas sp. GM80]EJN31002.1 hypothetical protein PMI37_02722 [Pseudomonas sp. GM80]
MADKSGTLQQQRNACFPTTTAKATGGCPLTGPDVAIVPMRYALDRSRYDEDPKKLKPLLKSGKWTSLPVLKTRSYTLRQLYKGYVYVYDETEKTLHEYSYSTSTGQLTRIKWTDADIGKDERSESGECKNHLLYPRKNTLHIAYSPNQWTWRICEHVRSNPRSRKEWMKVLNLPKYCITQSAKDTLPLSSIADAAADVDKDAVQLDKRLADSAIPPTASAGSIGEPVFNSLAADVFWAGEVPDKDSALIIALDAPLYILNDLGMQLAADHAAYQRWQEQHEHRIKVAQTVEALCGSSLAKEKMPSEIKDDIGKTRQYQRELDSYYTQRETEEDLAIAESASGSAPLIVPSQRFKAIQMRKALESKYSITLSEADYVAWKSREKWRRHVDLDGAHAYLQNHAKAGEILLQQTIETQADFETWAKHMGVDPEKLFCDTANEGQLLDLQNTFANLLGIYCQNDSSSKWLAKEEVTSTSLFGSVRFGFSEQLKAAFGEPSNKLLDGIGDYTNLATRAGEINSLVNHEEFSHQPWLKELEKSIQDTYENIRTLSIDKGKKTANAIILSLLPSDSRLASGKTQNLAALLRNMLIGQVLTNSPERIVVDAQIKEKIDIWKSEKRNLTKELDDSRKQWKISKRNGGRRGQGRKIKALEASINLHELKKPVILDFQNNKYAELLRDDIRKFAISKANATTAWASKAKSIAQRGGVNSASITWGVIILNIINTANTYHQAAKDGVIDRTDLIKTTYSAGYSANLIAAVFVESKWSSLKGLSTSINGSSTGIMEQSAAFWSSTQGETQLWGNAIRSFSRRLAAMGGLAIFSTALELWDIKDDYATANSSAEKAALWAKGLAVAGMGVGGALQLIAVTLFRSWTVVVMGAWFAFGMLVMGTIYLLATVALNYFKNDAIGIWLSKCSWAKTRSNSALGSPAEQAEEHRSLLEIQLSPQIHVQSTIEYRREYVPKIGSRMVPFQTGAWVQWRLPSALRGKTVEFNITGSKSRLNILPVTRTDDPVQDPFLDKGVLLGDDHFEKIGNSSPSQVAEKFDSEKVDPGKDFIWQAWVPLGENTDYLEFQIWYPPLIISGDSDDRGYLYQVEISTDGSTEADGLSKKNLQVKSASRNESLVLVLD